jgi:hypothetical protein
VFDDLEIPAKLHGCGDFKEAIELASDPSRRFDLIVSDTYRGDVSSRDVGVIDIVNSYRGDGKRFCPLVVYSSGVKPEALQESDFVRWADKAKHNGIEIAIKEILSTGVPQIARQLHDELDRSAGSFLWEFLEKTWTDLSAADMSHEVLERVIRRRAAAQISEMQLEDGKWAPIATRTASEYYIYPKLHAGYYGLGDVLRSKADEHDIRVILTPHCYLYVQTGQQAPRANYVLTVKAVSAAEVLGDNLTHAAAQTDLRKRRKKLQYWSQSPAKTERPPEGRHWYLPAFLAIPHLYCDFLQVTSIPFEQLEEYDPIATLVPPYAEAMQSCFASFYASVGIPETRPESIESLLG